jgi:hypothetical protein
MTEIPAHAWGQMKTIYGDWIQPYVMRFPGHVYCTAQADAVSTEGAWADKGAMKNMFGRVGLKPLGDKHYNPYLLASVLLTGNPSKGEYVITTVKDRKGREYLTNEPVAPLPFGFVTSYLCGVAGWVITQKFEKILPIVDVKADVWGIRVPTYLCHDHASELVRTTRDRWEITPLVNPKRKKAIEEQTAWDL